MADNAPLNNVKITYKVNQKYKNYNLQYISYVTKYKKKAVYTKY